MDKLNFGSRSLANIIRGSTPKDSKDIQNEFRDNSIDAESKTIVSGFSTKIIDNEQKEYRYFHIDHGNGMKPFDDINSSISAMKTTEKIGCFYNGFLDSAINTKADKIFVFSKTKQDSKMKLWIYHMNKLIQVTEDGFNQGKEGIAITHSYHRGDTKCIYGEYTFGSQDDAITNSHFEQSLKPLKENITDDELINSFIDGTIEQGTAIIVLWEGKNNINPVIQGENLKNYLKWLPYVRKLSKENVTNRFYIENELLDIGDINFGFFGNESNIIREIECFINPDTQDFCAVYNGKRFNITNILNDDEQESLINSNTIIKFNIRFTCVSNDIRDQQKSDLGLTDFKQLNTPVIETDYGFLGINNYKLPQKYTDRSSFGALEGYNSRVSIAIPKQHQTYLFKMLGVNGKKDKPENENPSLIASKIYDIILYIHKLYNNKFFKGNFPKDMFDKSVIENNGHNEETDNYFHDEDIEYVLNSFRNSRFSCPSKNSRLYKQWLQELQNNVTENEVTEDEVDENEVDEDELTENEDAQNEVIENEVIENEVIENEDAQNEVIENEVIENEVIENEVIENEVIENEVIENEVIENEVIENEDENIYQNSIQQIGSYSRNCVNYLSIDEEIAHNDKILEQLKKIVSNITDRQNSLRNYSYNGRMTRKNSEKMTRKVNLLFSDSMKLVS
jgi:hypothetical protein